MSGEMGRRFIADAMLGTLTKWLRILGYDVEYLRDAEDQELLRRAREEGRILLTRDKDLARRFSNSLYIPYHETKEQLRFVVERLGLNANGFLSRCAVDNTPLVRVPKESVRGKVPPRVYEAHDEFWMCPKCGRIYWKGTHVAEMENWLRELGLL